MIKLGINIDHIATLRNARNERYPSLEEGLKIVAKNSDFVTIHLREDRRHINDLDAKSICKDNKQTFVNFELAMNDEIINIALELKPDAICIVPEKRNEITTESGLNLFNKDVLEKLNHILPQFKAQKIRTSLFIDPNFDIIEQIKLLQTKPDACEIHLGKITKMIDDYIYSKYPLFTFNSFLKITPYTLGVMLELFSQNRIKFSGLIYNFKNIVFACNTYRFYKKNFEFLQNQRLAKTTDQKQILVEFNNIKNLSYVLHKNNIEVHAGHGISFLSLFILKHMRHIKEVSIGHFIISQSIFFGLKNTIKKMRAIIELC
jgi:pyridoxine 5'-phosphate synthase